jgi:K+ transporter
LAPAAKSVIAASGHERRREGVYDESGSIRHRAVKPGALVVTGGGVDFGDTGTSPWFALIPRRHLPSLPYCQAVIFTWLARNAGRANAYYRFPEERGRNRPASGALTAGMCSVDG